MSNDNKQIQGNIFSFFVQRKIGQIIYLISLLILPRTRYKLFYESLIKLKKIRRIKDRISIMAILQKVWNVRLYMHGCKRWVMLLTAFINIWKIIKWKEQKLQTVSIHFLLFIITSVKTNFKWSRGKHNIKKVEFPFDFMVIDCYVSPREMKEFGKKVRMLNVIWWNREIVFCNKFADFEL